MTGTASRISALLPRSETWRDQAACRDVPDPDIFFPEKGQHNKAAQAKAICARCPVSGPCLEYALRGPQAAHDQAGIFGGTTPRERLLLRRSLREREGQPSPHRVPNRYVADRQAAAYALGLAQRIGITAAARDLGVNATTLQRGWQRWGLHAPPPQRGPERSRFYTDPDLARHALALANQIGARSAARQLGVSPNTLYTAWERHHLGRPSHPRVTTGAATTTPHLRHERDRAVCRDQERER